MVLSKREFCRRGIRIGNAPMSFADRPYLREVYDSAARNIVLRASRQVEKSTFLGNTILYEAVKRPGSRILYVCPRIQQARVFTLDRILDVLAHSPLPRKLLLGGDRKPSTSDLVFQNGSKVHIRAAFHSADQCRGLSCQFLLVDEFQDLAAGELPVLQEVLSHFPDGRTIITGTPKTVHNHLEAVFGRSTANEWTIPCVCGRDVVLDERVLGPAGIICPGCKATLDARLGRWVPRNPGAAWGDGYWINHLIVPWLQYDTILTKQGEYDSVKFRNEVLGLPTELGGHVVTMAELEACCGDWPMARGWEDVPRGGQRSLVMGVDWGGGSVSSTVIAIGFMRTDYVFQLVYLERFRATEDPNSILEQVAERCRRFRCRCVAADAGGNGHVYNRLLFDRLKTISIYAILYVGSEQQPSQDGVLVKWSVDRSRSIGALFARVKKQWLLFPHLTSTRPFLNDFASVTAEYNEEMRRTRYVHSPSHQDDAVHAVNYAFVVATRHFRSVEDLGDA